MDPVNSNITVENDCDEFYHDFGTTTRQEEDAKVFQFNSENLIAFRKLDSDMSNSNVEIVLKYLLL